MRVLFMGTPGYAQVILEALLTSPLVEVVGVVCQPDKPVGRKQELQAPPVKASWLRTAPRKPLFQPTTLRDSGLVESWKSLKPDFIVVVAYGKILPRTVLDIAPCINLHASILPKYRGASPIHEAVRNGEAWSGVTAMRMEEGLDCGAILGYGFIPLSHDEDAETLFEKLASVAARLTLKVITNFSQLRPVVQAEVDSSYCRKLSKGDGLVDFTDARKLYRHFLAYRAWPTLWIASGLKLRLVKLVSSEGSYREGEILAVDNESVLVGCKKGSVKILRVQSPSKKEVDALSYIHGQRMGIGDTFF